MTSSTIVLLISTLAFCDAGWGTWNKHKGKGGSYGGCRGWGKHHYWNNKYSKSDWAYWSAWYKAAKAKPPPASLPVPPPAAPIASPPPPALPELPIGLLTYLNRTLAPMEEQWEQDGFEGPTTVEAARLVVSCLDGAKQSDVHSTECEKEYEWLSQCMECERQDVPVWLIAVVSAMGGIILVLSVMCVVVRARRHGAKTDLNLPKGQQVHNVKALPMESDMQAKIASDVEHTPVEVFKAGEC